MNHLPVVESWERLLPICAAMTVGAVATYLNRDYLWLAWRSRRWPWVLGRVVEKRDHQRTYVDYETNGTFAPVERSDRYIEVVYAYRVGNSSFRADRQEFSDYEWSNTCAYRIGAPVRVYYSPVNPKLAVLHPGFRMAHFTGPLLILGALAVEFYRAFS